MEQTGKTLVYLFSKSCQITCLACVGGVVARGWYDISLHIQPDLGVYSAKGQTHQSIIYHLPKL